MGVERSGEHPMPNKVTVVKYKGPNGKVVLVDAGLSKADKARLLFDAGFSVSTVSQMVPMAYSQAHSIHKKLGLATLPKPASVVGASSWGPTARTPTRKSMKPVKSPVLDAIKKGKPIQINKVGVGKVGRLRTPGLPSDTDCGECANCGYDVVIRTMPGGHYEFLHTGYSTEEYLATVQFCHAVPRVMLA